MNTISNVRDVITSIRGLFQWAVIAPRWLFGFVVEEWRKYCGSLNLTAHFHKKRAPVQKHIHMLMLMLSAWLCYSHFFYLLVFLLFFSSGYMIAMKLLMVMLMILMIKILSCCHSCFLALECHGMQATVVKSARSLR